MPIGRGLYSGAVTFAMFVSACLGCSMRPSPLPRELLIRDVTILSMDSEAPRRGSVLMRGDRIESIGPTASLPPAPNAHVVEGGGRFLIPGLIDMHTHVSKTRGSSLSLLVSEGVTTVHDVGGDHEELLAWRREIDAGTRIGPRLLIAGPYLESASNAARQHAAPASEMVEPTERTRVGVATPADADRIIAGLAARGVDHLKIRTTTDRDTYLASVPDTQPALPQGTRRPYWTAMVLDPGGQCCEPCAEVVAKRLAVPRVSKTSDVRRRCASARRTYWDRVRVHRVVRRWPDGSRGSSRWIRRRCQARYREPSV